MSAAGLDVPRPLTVLLVDESAMLRAMLKRVLQISGLPLGDVIEASRSAAALMALENQGVDAIFANIDPAQSQGHTLLTELREKPRNAARLLIAVTTRGLGTSREELDGLGVSGFANTPFRPEDIRELLFPLFRRA